MRSASDMDIALNTIFVHCGDNVFHGFFVLQRITGIAVVPDVQDVTVVPRNVSLQVLVPVTYTRPLSAADFMATVAASGMEQETPAAKLRVEVHPKNQLDPAIAIKGVQPPEVAVRRVK